MDKCEITKLFEIVSRIKDGPTGGDHSCPRFCVVVNSVYSRLCKLASGFDMADKDSIERPRSPEVVRGDSGDEEREERGLSSITISSPSSPEVLERASEEWTSKDKRLLTGRKHYPKVG